MRHIVIATWAVLAALATPTASRAQGPTPDIDDLVMFPVAQNCEVTGSCPPPDPAVWCLAASINFYTSNGCGGIIFINSVPIDVDEAVDGSLSFDQTIPYPVGLYYVTVTFFYLDSRTGGDFGVESPIYTGVAIAFPPPPCP